MWLVNDTEWSYTVNLCSRWIHIRVMKNIRIIFDSFVCWFKTVMVSLWDVCVLFLVRTQSQCFRLAAVLVVSEMTSGQCERPQSGIQRISAHVNDVLSCPLRRYLKSVDHPSIQWYKVENTLLISIRADKNKTSAIIYSPLILLFSVEQNSYSL